MKSHATALLIFNMTLAVFANGCFAAPVVPPRGGAAIMLKNPVWLTGVQEAGEGTKQAPYASGYPLPVKTAHFVVVNAGYWLANQSKPTQAIYEFALTVANPFEHRVYTRALLDNPAESASPIKYEHYLDPEERSTKVTHGPLSGIKQGSRYKLLFEVYSDEGRSILLERVEQEIIAPLDNTSGCVVLTPDIMLAAFPSLSNAGVPINKVILACDK